MVQQVDEPKNLWIFVTKSPTRRIALRKERLSQEQRAELAAFIEARQLNKRAGRAARCRRLVTRLLTGLSDRISSLRPRQNMTGCWPSEAPHSVRWIHRGPDARAQVIDAGTATMAERGPGRVSSGADEKQSTRGPAHVQDPASCLGSGGRI